jgi:hypothetical protein
VHVCVCGQNLNHEAMRVCSVISAVIVGGIFTLFAGSAILGSCSYVTVGFVSFAVGLCCVSCRMISLNGVKKRRSDPDGDSEEVSAAQAQAFNSGQAMQPQAWGNPEAPFTPGMGGGSKWDLVQPAPCGTPAHPDISASPCPPACLLPSRRAWI